MTTHRHAHRQSTPSQYTHDNPLSVEYVNAAHPGDNTAFIGRHSFDHMYTHKCPTCGEPAMLAVYEVTTPHDPTPRLKRQLICRSGSMLPHPRRRKPKLDAQGQPIATKQPCPAYDVPADEVVQ